MCGYLFGIVWILGGIAAIIQGARGKSIDIGHKRRYLLGGSSAVIVGIVAIIIGFLFFYWISK